ncbi:MAG: NeuD/PglB/VioB family sugar acetyltransferase [Planctomycetaceae bacterium]
MRLAIYGSGGLGREVYELAEIVNQEASKWDEIFFVDDVRGEGSFLDTRCVRFETLIDQQGVDLECVIAIGEPKSRLALFEKIVGSGVQPATLVHPRALVSPKSCISVGSIICEFASVHVNARIGLNCLVQPGCVVGHEARIGDHSVLSPLCAVGGASVLGEYVFAGMQSSIKEKLTIGNDVIIAMGATVFQDLPDGVTVVGNPARITRGREDRKVF